MRINERLSRLEDRGDIRERRQQIEADAADFMVRMQRLTTHMASQPRATGAQFRASILRSGSPFLVTTFLGETHADR
jgi:hypothetical protein